MSRTILILLLSFILFVSCEEMTIREAFGSLYWGDKVMIGLLGICLMIAMAILIEKLHSIPKQTPQKLTKSIGDKNLLIFAFDHCYFFKFMGEFLKEVDTTVWDDLYKKKDVEYRKFYNYMKTISEEAWAERLFSVNESNYTDEDWAEARITREYIPSKLGFVDGVRKIVDDMERYIISQKECVKNLPDQEKVMVYYKRMESFVKNGKQFICIADKISVADDYDFVN